MYNALFMGWNAPKTGRERQAGELFGVVLDYLGREQKKGTIDSVEPLLLSVHGGDLNGFFLIRGDGEKLSALRESDEFMKVVMQAGFCLDGFGVIPAYQGEALNELMGKWTQMVGSNA